MLYVHIYVYIQHNGGDMAHTSTPATTTYQFVIGVSNMYIHNLYSQVHCVLFLSGLSITLHCSPYSNIFY